MCNQLTCPTKFISWPSEIFRGRDPATGNDGIPLSTVLDAVEDPVPTVACRKSSADILLRRRSNLPSKSGTLRLFTESATWNTWQNIHYSPVQPIIILIYDRLLEKTSMIEHIWILNKITLKLSHIARSDSIASSSDAIGTATLLKRRVDAHL